jgi:hypothetical protein
MFTIDLLKGQGIPMRVTLQAVAVVAAAALFPVVMGIAVFFYYTNSVVTLSVQQQQLAGYRAKTAKLSDDVAHKEAIEGEISAHRSCLAEVNSLVVTHYQWSPVLGDLVESIPESLVLRTLQVRDRSLRKKIQDPQNPHMTKEISVAAKTLMMNVRVTSGSDSDAVEDLQEKLYSSESLGPMVEKIVVSRQTETFEDHSVTSYDIGCLLRSKI